MTNQIFILLCVVAITVSVSSVFIVLYVTKLAASVSRMNAANNVWEYQALERAASFSNSRIFNESPSGSESIKNDSGQTQTDGTLTDDALINLSQII